MTGHSGGDAHEPRLRLLDDVTWRRRPIRGARVSALLTLLAAADGRALSTGELIRGLWQDDPPADPGKALQVVVSRARSATAPNAVAHTANGYRLALSRGDVDSWTVRDATVRARSAIARGDARAAEADARTTHEAGMDAEGLLGRVLSGLGRHDEALPLLESAPATTETLTALLRSEASVRGAAAALERYERHRHRLAESLGVDPAPELQALHRELLARNRPVRSGVRYDAGPLLGREDDLNALDGLLRSARVVTLLGPGGIGKTRLAHAVARRADQPVVHVVELVGVTDEEDVVAELGAALGVRDSVTSRRMLTPDQRADVRSRVAEHLAQAPTLLVLDNCEHVIDAVADLTAYLVALAPGLTVLTTSRAPLAIAAERVYPLAQLGTRDGTALFTARATAVRPDAELPTDVVAEIVERLDGLPLAIELAAARMRTMSAPEIARRLNDRFALLRGGDRAAPDRHRTLLAVIDWSWNLLAPSERDALRRAAVFQDGFSLEAAETVLAGDAAGTIDELVAQSLLTVSESGGVVRYRMLETVREFGRLRLRETGEEDAAYAALQRWAVNLADRASPRLFGPDQLATVDLLSREEANLADVLRRALDGSAPEDTVALFVALSGFWAIRGDLPRAMTSAEAVTRLLDTWDPPADHADRARAATGIALFTTTISGSGEAARLRAVLDRIGSETASPALDAMIAIAVAISDPGNREAHERCVALTAAPQRVVRSIGLTYLAHQRENAGDSQAAMAACSASLSLVTEQDGPWLRATALIQLANLYAQIGDGAQAAEHARLALPLLEKLGAVDDSFQARLLLAMVAIDHDDLDAAGRVVAEIEQHVSRAGPQAGSALQLMQGQLALAADRVPEGLALFRRAVEEVRVAGPQGNLGEGLMPWVIATEATTLTAEARYADREAGLELFTTVVRKLAALLDSGRPFIDFPLTGLMFFATGSWALHREAVPFPEAVRMLVIAKRFTYPRLSPLLRWDHAAERAEQAAPGLLGELEAEFGEGRGADLLPQARAALASFTAPSGSPVT